MVDNIEAKVYERLRAGESIESIANSFTSAMNKANARYNEELKVEADKQIQVNRLLDLLNSLRDYISDYSPVDVSEFIGNEPITREVAEESINIFDSVIEQVASQMKDFTAAIADTTPAAPPEKISRSATFHAKLEPSIRNNNLTPEERIENWLRRNNL